jgi:hypothetical protein
MQLNPPGLRDYTVSAEASEVWGFRERTPEREFMGRLKAERAPGGPPIFEINLRYMKNGVIRIDELF